VDDDMNVWAACSGGLFKYETGTEKLIPYTNIDALLSLDISSVLCGNNGEVYAGSTDGVIHVLDKNGKWSYLTDIRSAGKPNPAIRKMFLYDEKLYAVGGFGISVIDKDQHIFIESASKFGDLPANAEVRDATILGDSVFLATSTGIAAAKINKSLVDPNNWVTYKNKDLGNNTFFHITAYKGQIYAGTEENIYIVKSDTFLLHTKVEYGLTGLKSTESNLYYSSLSKIISSEGEIAFPHSEPVSGFIVLDEQEGKFLVTLKKYGISLVKSGESKEIVPNSPNSNLYSSTDVDSQGNFWVASSSGGGTGVMKFDGENWTNYTAKLPEIETNDFFKIKSGSNGKTIASTWGDGFYIFGNDGSITHYDESNTPMKGIASAPTYTLAGCSEYDFIGNLWVVNYGENSAGPVLIAMEPSGTVHSFQNNYSANARHYVAMTIDYSGTKWLGSTEKFNSGLYYFNERNTLEDLSDDIFGTFTSSSLNNLPANTINDLATDKQGKVWVATSSGICQILNPGAVLSNQKPIAVFSNLIGNVQVYDVEVDAIDNKWVATSSGLWVLDAEGTEVLAIINKSNSPLTTDVIESISLDDATGRVFIGTKEGLFTAYSLSVAPEDNHNISCYPQPFKPRKDNEIVIEGLAGNSDVRILTTNGQLVASIQCAGAKTIWNGKDQNGNYVQTGVYLIVASSETSGATAVQKIAVIND
jgi:ligand-binding sensor domain-containing protein